MAIYKRAQSQIEVPESRQTMRHPVGQTMEKTETGEWQVPAMTIGYATMPIRWALGVVGLAGPVNLGYFAWEVWPNSVARGPL